MPRPRNETPNPAVKDADKAVILSVTASDGSRWYVRADPETFDIAVKGGEIKRALPGGMNKSRFEDNAKWKLNCAQVVSWVVD